MRFSGTVVRRVHLHLQYLQQLQLLNVAKILYLLVERTANLQLVQRALRFQRAGLRLQIQRLKIELALHALRNLLSR